MTLVCCFWGSSLLFIFTVLFHIILLPIIECCLFVCSFKMKIRLPVHAFHTFLQLLHSHHIITNLAIDMTTKTVKSLHILLSSGWELKGSNSVDELALLLRWPKREVINGVRDSVWRMTLKSRTDARKKQPSAHKGSPYFHWNPSAFKMTLFGELPR